MSFELHPQLAKDCFVIGEMKLCKILLMNNRLFPWIIVVPMIEQAEEITDLTAKERTVLMQEITHISGKLHGHTEATKMNIGALGNKVRQLHVHVIARFEGDRAWPEPVWGKGHEPYAEEDAKQCVRALRHLFKLS